MGFPSTETEERLLDEIVVLPCASSYLYSRSCPRTKLPHQVRASNRHYGSDLLPPVERLTCTIAPATSAEGV